MAEEQPLNREEQDVEEVATVEESVAAEPPEDEVSTLREQLAEAQAQAQEYLDGWQRARAEFVNYRRREEQRRQALEEEITARVVSKFLPVLDDMDRAFQAIPQEARDSAWVEGLAMVKRKFHTVLEKEGLSPIEVQPGERFDPNYHEAITHEPSDEFEAGEIIEVVQRGYMLNDNVLRPALVRVSSGREGQEG